MEQLKEVIREGIMRDWQSEKVTASTIWIIFGEMCLNAGKKGLL